MNRKVALTARFHLDFEETLQQAADAGFQYISIGFGEGSSLHFFHQPGWEKELADISRMLEKKGLQCINTHLPSYDLRVSGELTDGYIDLAQKRCLRAAHLLGADVCAYHCRTHLTGGEDLEKAYQETHAQLLPLVEEAERQNVVVGVENLPIFPGWPLQFLPCFTADQNRLIDAFGSKHICAVWDTGHAHLMQYNQAEAIRAVGSRIKATHIHDNIKADDLHNPPFMGSIDWPSVMGALKSTGYEGYLTLEASYFANAFSAQYVRYLYDAICMVEDIFKQA